MSNKQEKKKKSPPEKRLATQPLQLLRGLSVTGPNPARRCFCCCSANDPPVELITDPGNDCGPCPIIAADNNPFCLAFGFNGDNAGRPVPAPVPVKGAGSAPATRRRIEGPPTAPAPLSPSFDDEGSVVLLSNPAKGRLSVPRACRRAFSCFA